MKNDLQIYCEKLQNVLGNSDRKKHLLQCIVLLNENGIPEEEITGDAVINLYNENLEKYKNDNQCYDKVHNIDAKHYSSMFSLLKKDINSFNGNCKTDITLFQFKNGKNKPILEIVKQKRKEFESIDNLNTSSDSELDQEIPDTYDFEILLNHLIKKHGKNIGGSCYTIWFITYKSKLSR